MPSATILHEIGHTLGLKHGHYDDGVHGVLPPDHDSSEWSLMTYYSYLGGPLALHHRRRQRQSDLHDR